MRQVGTRSERPTQVHANGQALVAGAQFSMSIARLSGGSTFVPKGLYRFRTHDDAAQQNADWLATGMARIAMERQRG